MTYEQDASEALRLSCVEATDRLIDALAVRGFQQVDDVSETWRGVLHIDVDPDGVDVHTLIDVQIPADYPYAQPKITPLSSAAAMTRAGSDLSRYYEASSTWHREPSGHLCLFEHADHSRLPWADAGDLLEQVQAWLREDRAGWPTGAPALDLERYLSSTGEVVLFDDPRSVAGKVVHLKRRGSVWVVDLPAKVPRGRRGVKARWSPGVALVLDVGELDRPIRDWPSLLDAAGEQAHHLHREVASGIRELVLTYRRGSAAGVLALRLRPTASGWTVKAHTAAPRDTASLTRRAHPKRNILAQLAITVVGVGAIGSVLTDLLHRSGVGRLHLVDPDIVLPGNVIRHLVGADQVGKPKVTAVAHTVRSARPESDQNVTTEHGRITSLQAARDLFRTCDLVVDATADSTASTLIGAAARAGAGRAISVCVLADGYAIRVDHWPEPSTGTLAAPVLPPVQSGTYETGCSSPISTTPPAAAWEAAALGARHAIDVVLGISSRASEQRILHAQGTLR
ncbi:ThiF family adenylyltransferase (plasmid) [Rhodococcus sp. ZPP]|uniref:HesA/MoeB/ThiF family protein n=1 Tax=Rhodococcus sp. ZPP TaxID=2749906 RepID=UPI001AD895D9|nr:ThiF family adenylyltransferase [Rhodococcus sp. ZPP]QTJ71032.1 ThiF family adenylyltransferase [Rhodococcus sp. ZPP]